MDKSKLYCIIVKRELEDDYVTHVTFSCEAGEPTREDVLEYVMELDLNYDDNYHSFKYYPADGRMTAKRNDCNK